MITSTTADLRSPGGQTPTPPFDKDPAGVVIVVIVVMVVVVFVVFVDVFIVDRRRLRRRRRRLSQFP